MMNELEIINQFHYTSIFWCVALPIFLCMIDVMTGYVNAWKKDELSSKKMREGLAKKFGEMILCLLGWLGFLSFGVMILALFPSLYISVMELTSISENLDKLGVPIPNFIRKKLNNLKEDLDPKDDNKE